MASFFRREAIDPLVESAIIPQQTSPPETLESPRSEFVPPADTPQTMSQIMTLETSPFNIAGNTPNYPDLHDVLVANEVSHTLISTLMPLPLSGVAMTAQRAGESLHVYGKVTFESEDACRAVMRLFTNHVESVADSRGVRTHVRGGFQIVRGPNGVRLGIGLTRGYNKDQIHITTSHAEEGYKEHIDLLPAPELTPESVQSSVEDVLSAMSLIGMLAYSGANQDTIDPALFRSLTETGKPSVEVQPRQSDITRIERVSFEDIAGNNDAKRLLHGYAQGIKHPEIYAEWGTRPAKGVLLYGPPGTGKTLLAKATATAADVPFYAKSPSDIGSKWYGESEKIIKDYFKQAKRHPAAIVFLDEVDTLMPDRDNAHEATKKVLGVLLQEMDGIEKQGNVLVLAATNRRDSLDEALLRPGRFDRHIEVGLPSLDALREAFAIHMRLAQSSADREIFVPDIDTAYLASVVDGMTGSHVAEIIRSILEERVLHQLIEGKTLGPVSQSELESRIKTFKSTLLSRQG